MKQLIAILLMSLSIGALADGDGDIYTPDLHTCSCPRSPYGCPCLDANR